MGRALSVVVFRIELADVVPMVWRRVRVPAAYTLRRVHGVIQIAMGWQDCHLHEYRVGDTRVGMADRADVDVPEGLEGEEEWTVADVLNSGATEFEYVYDFGDQWRHRIVIEPATRLRVPGASLLCLAGENACPPEDVGGPPGYAQFLEALTDAAHPDHKSYVDRCGGVWDVKGFDLNRVNRKLLKADAAR